MIGRLDKDDLSTKLAQLSHKIEEVKVEVYNALVQKYTEFYPLFDTTVQLRARVADLHADIDSALTVIEKQVLSITVSVNPLVAHCCHMGTAIKHPADAFVLENTPILDRVLDRFRSEWIRIFSIH